MEGKQLVEKRIKESVQVKTALLEQKDLIKNLDKLSDLCIEVFKREGKVLFCGNGGSAADAQHLSAELTGRFYKDRDPLFSEALHVNSSYLTAVANDYSYEEIYARLIKGKGKKGDVLIGLSTSGNSENVIRAFDQAKKMGIHTVAFTGDSGGKMKDMTDFLFNMPSSDTPRIQECHMLLGHILCELIESKMF